MCSSSAGRYTGSYPIPVIFYFYDMNFSDTPIPVCVAYITLGTASGKRSVTGPTEIRCSHIITESLQQSIVGSEQILL